MTPVIALVGRPNVGKSTLFNVLTQSRDALVADYPGLTRDRKYGHGSSDSKNFIVIDTGGLSGENEELDEHMAAQTLYAIEESSVVLLLSMRVMAWPLPMKILRKEFDAWANRYTWC